MLDAMDELRRTGDQKAADMDEHHHKAFDLLSSRQRRKGRRKGDATVRTRSTLPNVDRVLTRPDTFSPPYVTGLVALSGTWSGSNAKCRNALFCQFRKCVEFLQVNVDRLIITKNA